MMRGVQLFHPFARHRFGHDQHAGDGECLPDSQVRPDRRKVRGAREEEKREREAKVKAATPRSYGDRGNSARPAQPRTFGNDNRGGSSRVGVRGRFKD